MGVGPSCFQGGPRIDDLDRGVVLGCGIVDDDVAVFVKAAHDDQMTVGFADRCAGQLAGFESDADDQGDSGCQVGGSVGKGIEAGDVARKSERTGIGGVKRPVAGALVDPVVAADRSVGNSLVQAWV